MSPPRPLALALVALAATPAAAAPEALAFAAGAERLEVPQGGLARVEAVEGEGLRVCPAPAVEAALAAFTERHRGEVVTVTIGERPVIHLEVVEPYAGGCVGWPLHPRAAAAYRARLIGEEPG